MGSLNSKLLLRDSKRLDLLKNYAKDEELSELYIFGTAV